LSYTNTFVEKYNNNRKKLFIPSIRASAAIEKNVSFSCFKTNSIEYGPNALSTKAVILVRPEYILEASVESEK